MIVYDTETCGLHGVCVLIQYQVDEGPVHLFCPWREPVARTLELIEMMMEHDNIGFNLAFDQFHLSKLYTMWNLLPRSLVPDFDIDRVVSVEKEARDGPCVKPKRACDLMLHARRGPYQSTMARKDIKIKRIHGSIVEEVREYLEKHIQIDDLYFAGRKNQHAQRFIVRPCDDTDEWFDIVLKLKPSAALKVLAEVALGHDTIKYGELEGPPHPIEVGYAPFAEAVSSKERGWWGVIEKGNGIKRGWTWPALVKEHIGYWSSNPLARKYATNDVVYTRELWEHFGCPEPGDIDSELACKVGANRWRGYAVDFRQLSKLRETVEAEAKAAPKAPNQVKKYLEAVVTPVEQLAWEGVTGGSTKKTVLEELATWEDSELGRRAAACLRARQAKYTLDLIKKLEVAGRFHVAAEVIGTKSGRMAGRGGDLNSQGIGRAEEIRRCFKLAQPGMVLCGGDFDAFEVVLAIKVFGDKKLAEDVSSGKKIHALFGRHVFPHMTYEEILADKEVYTRCKSGLFALIYFGEAFTLKGRLGVEMEDAEAAYASFMQEYHGIARGRQQVVDAFSALTQPNGIGTQVKWKDPAEYSETMFGFKRYFTLENQIVKELFTLAQHLPKHWQRFKATVKRRDREQTLSGAIQSALYAAAFALQGANVRAAGNHLIQGAGAHITKVLEKNLWDLQPHGVHPWKVQPFNEHDEIMSPCTPEMVEAQETVVRDTINHFRNDVPLLDMGWQSHLSSWAEKS